MSWDRGSIPRYSTNRIDNQGGIPITTIFKAVDTNRANDMVLTVSCQLTDSHQMVNEVVKQIVSDAAHDLHLALERQSLPSTVVVCSGDGTAYRNRVVEKFTT